MRIKPKLSFFKSLRFRIMVIMIIIGIVPGFIIEGMLIGSYEDRAVELRQITVRNQCDILGNQLMREGYLQQKSEVIDGELSMISSAFSARVLVINRNGRIIEDTYDIDEGKYAFSEEVIQCFEGVNTSVYDRNNTYIELTIPLTNGNSDQIEGVMLVSTSTIEIQDTIGRMEHRGNLLMLIISMLVIFFSFIVSKILVKPFSRVSKAIEELTDGYLDEEISVTDYTETEMITNVFNKLLKRMKILDDSRQEFVANVSHELKTPLAVIQNYATILQCDELTPEERKEYSRRIGNAASRLSVLVTNILQINRLDNQKIKPALRSFNLSEELSRCILNYDTLLDEKEIELETQLDQTLILCSDESLLDTVWNNLISNAVKFTPQKGKIGIEARQEGHDVLVTISDSGCGIPPEAIHRIFDKFYQADSSHATQGNGLGLALVKRILHLLGGDISVSSTPQKGSVFTVRLSA